MMEVDVAEEVEGRKEGRTNGRTDGKERKGRRRDAALAKVDEKR